MVVEATQSVRFAELPDADRIFGSTPRMREVRARIEAAVSGNLPVLIEGESGTGKEVVARYLHLHSIRHSGPFVRVNCAAMTPRMLEAELFGTEPGMGNLRNLSAAMGSLGLAASGTLFLDEITEMDEALQQKLAHVIGTDDRMKRAMRARIVCSSSVNMQRAILEGRGTEALLSSFGHLVSLAPLRERKGDIPELCEYLLEKFARHPKRTSNRFP